jgi:hypothetical protein
MRYQALILLLIILISSYIFKNNSVFSQNKERVFSQQASVINLSKSNFLLPSTSRNTKTSNDIQNTIENDVQNKDDKDVSQDINSLPTSDLSNSQKEITKIEPLEETNGKKIEPIIIEQNIIEQENNPQDEVCQPTEAKISLAQTIEGASILYEKKSNNRWPIASITKLMTAIIALENINQSDLIKINPEIIKEANGYAILSSGSYTVNDLIKAMIVASSNDAALAIADSLGRDEFVRKMNQKAKELSMSQTTYYEPSGLSYLNQSTAHDLYLLLSYIRQKYPIILDISRQKSVTIINKTTRKKQTLMNTNDFAGRNDFYGGKTGFIDQSEGNLVTLFKKNGKMVFIAVLGSPNRFQDTEKILSCIK